MFPSCVVLCELLSSAKVSWLVETSRSVDEISSHIELTDHAFPARIPHRYLQHRNVLELGAGTGLASIIAALAGANVTCTTSPCVRCVRCALCDVHCVRCAMCAMCAVRCVVIFGF